MMTRNLVFCLMVATIFYSAAAFAQYTDEQHSDFSYEKDNADLITTPAGMEARKVNNDVSVLIPKGGKMYRRNRTTYIAESADEYSARQLLIVEAQISKLKKENKELREELNKLKSILGVSEEADDKDAQDTGKE